MLRMAESKSDHFSFSLNRHSEKPAKFPPFTINRLSGDSECGERADVVWRQDPKTDKPQRNWRILSAYAEYYNQTRTHLALNKDCPLERPIQRFGSVVATSVLAGLHHQYVRI
jgi:hypothetical protein